MWVTTLCLCALDLVPRCRNEEVPLLSSGLRLWGAQLAPRLLEKLTLMGVFCAVSSDCFHSGLLFLGHPLGHHLA